jgi:hypothetical protein
LIFPREAKRNRAGKSNLGKMRAEHFSVKFLLIALSRRRERSVVEAKPRKSSFARYIIKYLNNFNVMDIKEIEKRIMDFAKKRASAKNFDLTPGIILYSFD